LLNHKFCNFILFFDFFKCYWLGAHCYDYVLDCEDLQTAKLCKGAKTQDVICLWNGSECDDGAYNPSMFSNNINNNYGNQTKYDAIILFLFFFLKLLTGK
jgi:hypothetical protein